MLDTLGKLVEKPKVGVPVAVGHRGNLEQQEYVAIRIRFRVRAEMPRIIQEVMAYDGELLFLFRAGMRTVSRLPEPCFRPQT